MKKYYLFQCKKIFLGWSRCLFGFVATGQDIIFKGSGERSHKTDDETSGKVH